MNELLGRVLEVYGGMERWRSAKRLAARISTGGLAFWCRGRFALRRIVVEVDPHRPRAWLRDYPRSGRTGHFEAERVAILGAGVDASRRVRDPARARLAYGRLRWDDLDLLYFVGYAIWNYLTLPWLLASEDVEIMEVRRGARGGREVSTLRAVFPERLPTHCREQSFVFDEDLRLRRHDYTAEVFGAWAHAAHSCSDHRTFDGLLFPTKRRVHPRWRGRRLSVPTLVWIDVDDVVVSF